MEEIVRTLFKSLIFIAFLNGIKASSKDFQNVTSKTMTVDEWLNSEDLFPGHTIPHNLHHSDAQKMFTRLLEDQDIISKAYERYRVFKIQKIFY